MTALTVTASVAGSQCVFWRPFAALQVVRGPTKKRSLAAVLLAAIYALTLLLGLAGHASASTAPASETAVAAQTVPATVFVGLQTPETPATVGPNGSFGYDGALGCCVAPRTPAQQAADAAADGGRSRGAAAQFEVDGQTFVDVSGSNTPLHPAVQDTLETVPHPRKPWHGGCAEPRCVSQALDAGVDPSNGTMAAVQIGDGGNVPHGAVRPPCPSCEVLRDIFGYDQ